VPCRVARMMGRRDCVAMVRLSSPAVIELPAPSRNFADEIDVLCERVRHPFEMGELSAANGAV